MTAQIRIATAEDAATILAIYAPFCASTTVSFELVAPGEDQIRERIVSILPLFPWLVCEVDDQVAGYVYASRHRERAAYQWAVDVAVYVGDSYRRRCIGRALYTSLVALLREQGYFQAYAGITLPNTASIGLHEAMGFQPLAVFPSVGFKLGRWLDVGWWKLQLMPPVENPPIPRPFHDIRDSPSARRAIAAGMPYLRQHG